MLDGTTEILAAAGLAEVLSADTVAQPEKTAVKMRAVTRKVWSVAGCGKAKPRNDDCDRVPRMGANVVGGTRSIQSGRRTTLVQGVDPVPLTKAFERNAAIMGLPNGGQEAQETKQQPTRTVSSLNCFIQTRLRFTRTGGRIGT